MLNKLQYVWRKFKFSMLLLVCSLIYFSCTDMDSIHEDYLNGEIILFNKSGHEIVNLGAHYGDGMSGNGILNINNENGEYGWSVIGKVSSEHYK